MYSTRHSFPIFKKHEFSRQIFEKSSDVKVHENPSSLNRDVPCGQTDRQTGITKLTVTLPIFAKAPEKNERMVFDGMDPSSVVMN